MAKVNTPEDKYHEVGIYNPTTKKQYTVKILNKKYTPEEWRKAIDDAIEHAEELHKQKD